MAYTEEELKKELETKEYEYGFYTDIKSDTFPPGLNEEVVIAISKKKEEPEWMTLWRLEAFQVLERNGRARLAERYLPKARFSSNFVLFGAKQQAEIR